MNTFFKNISIYGILPLVGRFIGFFLVPIYARVFSSAEYGQIQLVIALVNFLVYFISLEFYTSIGRYFYDRPELNRKRTLVSTGLWMTVMSAAIVVILCLVFQDAFLRYYLDDKALRGVLLAGVVWLGLDGISSYLNVIPRYTEKAKAYVIINACAILVRAASTIVYVVVLDTGIAGVLYGHMTGTVLAIVSNIILSRKYLGFTFSVKDLRLIFNYAILLMPGVIITALWVPTIRKSIEDIFSVAIVGQFAMAASITSLATMFKGALMNAWRPLLFERRNDPAFFGEVRRNSSTVAFVILTLSCFLTLFSYEICLIIGTEEFVQSMVFIPFLCMVGYLQAVTQLRGFGPLITDHTYIDSLVALLSYAAGLGFLLSVGTRLGLFGIGIAIVLYEFVYYAVLYRYTLVKIRDYCTSLVVRSEYFVLALFIVCGVVAMLHAPLAVRIAVGGALLVILLQVNARHYHILTKIKVSA